MNIAPVVQGVDEVQPAPVTPKFALKPWDFLLILLLCLLLYLPSISAPWVSDDNRFITGNPAIKSLSNVPQFFLHPGKTTASTSGYEGIFRPLRTTSFAIDFAVWGPDQRGFHLTNIFLHVAASVLLFLICRALYFRRGAALAAGLLFAAHPAQVEAVTWISSRADPMAAVFFFASFLFFLSARQKERTGWRLAAAWVLFVLALLSKESAIVLPVIFLLFDFTFLGKKAPGRRSLAAQYGLFFGTAAAYFVIRMAVLGQVTQQSLWGGSLLATLLTMSRCFFIYLKLVFLPGAGNCLEYLVPLAMAPFTPDKILPFVGVLVVIAAVIFLIRTASLTGFGLAWFLIALAPVSNILPMSMLMGERFLYIPLAGLCITFGTIAHGFSDSGAFRRRMFHIGICVVLFVLGLLTVPKNSAWRNPELLWSQSLERYPESYRSRMGLAEVYYNRGETTEAIKQYEHALRIFPNVQVLHDLGNAYRQDGDFRSAIASYRSALALDPDSAWTWTSLGITYLLQGKSAEAIDTFQRAIRLERNYWIAHYYLGLALEVEGKLENALQELQIASQLAPEHEEIHERIVNLEGKLQENRQEVP